MLYKFIAFSILKEENTLSKIILILFVLSFVFLSTVPGFSGTSFNVPNTDRDGHALIGFFDLRDRETFIQITNIDEDSPGANIHIQIFNVGADCNENNFFDFYTPFDTHTYNLRDIVTNDGNPSGVVLPDDAYGIFAAIARVPSNSDIIGNLRILDDSGYEYRTNLQDEQNEQSFDNTNAEDFITFNFNTKGGVTLSDVVGIPFDDSNQSTNNSIMVADILNIYHNLDVDIFDLNENPFSCRNVAFACVTLEHPLYEALLEEIEDDGGSASVANHQFGINNAIPHSRGGELLCPGNTISEGFVRFDLIEQGGDTDEDAIFYIGLNNGNGRGSLDAVWLQNTENDDFLGGD